MLPSEGSDTHRNTVTLKSRSLWSAVKMFYAVAIDLNVTNRASALITTHRNASPELKLTDYKLIMVKIIIAKAGF